VGRYRTDTEPMQVVSCTLASPKVHFEAPPTSGVPHEMTRFVKWFNRTAPTGSDPLPALTRSGIAHIYVESIRPFGDGTDALGVPFPRRRLRSQRGSVHSPRWPPQSSFCERLITQHSKLRTRTSP
jgi:hypothetical protein